MVAAWLAVVLFAVAAAAVYLGAAVVARHRAQAVADLAALAGAASLPAGGRVACSRVTEVAHRMRVDSPGCEVDGLDVVVTVRVSAGLAGTAQAAARAGPDRAGNGGR